MRAAIRVRQYSRRTEKTYLLWVRRFILFLSKRHPGEMGEHKIGEFLSHLAVNENFSGNTQNRGLNANVFRCGHVLAQSLGKIGGVARANKSANLPVVLTQDEVARVLSRLSGVRWLVASLQYGSELRRLVI